MPVDGNSLRSLVGTSETDIELALFMTQGQLVVDEYLSDSSLSTSVKDSIALYLAGHFYVLSRESGGITYARVGQSEEKYRSVASDKVGFLTTRFGQTACALDSTGVLASKSAQTATSFMFDVVSSADRVG